jgi:ABC-2 type transport system permease protein
MSFSRTFAIFIRQWFLFITNPIRFASTFLWLLIDILQWGFISRYLDSFGQATLSLVTVLLGAIILWEFMSRLQQGIMMAFLEDSWSRNFINYFASPLQIKEYLGGLTFFSFATSFSGFTAMAIIAGLLFGYDILKIGIFLLPFMAILLIFGISIGFLITGMVFRFGPSAEWISWPIPLVLSILCGVYYPISVMPMALKFLARLIPATYVFEGARTILSAGNFNTQAWMGLFVGLILAIAYLLAAYFYFISVYRHNLKTGGIARFSI